MTAKRWLPAVLLLPMLAACGSASDLPSPDAQTPAAPAPAAPAPEAHPGASLTVDLDDRPFQMYVPESYDPEVPVPLVVSLHGYTSSAAEQERYFQLTPESDRRGFLLAMPEGTTDQAGDQFWNATDVCCDRYDAGVDDSAYLRASIDLMISAYSVDPTRVYLVGHSNGGFMAYRMACDHADVVTAVVSLAGLPDRDPSRCAPHRPVSVLQIHGTADGTVPYEGSSHLPSAEATLEMWRGLDGCAGPAETGEPLDLVADLPGPETTVTAYATGCRDGSRVELWTIEDGGHVPQLSTEFTSSILDFLETQS